MNVGMAESIFQLNSERPIIGKLNEDDTAEWWRKAALESVLFKFDQEIKSNCCHNFHAQPQQQQQQQRLLLDTEMVAKEKYEKSSDSSWYCIWYFGADD